MLLGRNGRSRWRHAARAAPDTDTVPMVRPGLARASADTEGPVFVDATGRRARTVRRLAYGLGVPCAAYTVVLVLSFMGATPFAPSSVLPLPGVPSNVPETTRQDPPGTPSSSGVSVSPTEVPGLPVPTPSASGSASSPVGGPSGTPTTGGPGTTPSASTSGPGPSGSPSTSPVESGSSPTESPTTGSGETSPSVDESAISAPDPSGATPPAVSGVPSETSISTETPVGPG
jgi:hypothetical protein